MVCRFGCMRGSRAVGKAQTRTMRAKTTGRFPQSTASRKVDQGVFLLKKGGTWCFELQMGALCGGCPVVPGALCSERRQKSAGLQDWTVQTQFIMHFGAPCSRQGTNKNNASEDDWGFPAIHCIPQG